ncbi:MAG: RNA polymerase sigma factor [Proteobacteria bacterium]|nr:RNA polymerase sigma factor [Pseudomonadota bacterium]
MSTAHADDLELARRVLAGDHTAFGQLFEDYFPRLFRFILRRADRNVEVAQDVVQSALLKGLRNLASYRGEASLFTWLCQIARHEFADQRTRQQTADRILVALENDPSVRAALESLQWAELAEPQQALEREQRDDLVHAALDYLPSRYAHLLEMKYVEELPVEHIAQRLGTTATAVQSLLSRARAAFREAHAALTEGLDGLAARGRGR